eukprot:NODE_317_length_11122_cov_0.359521.p3 type:complete len:346 gc:universal NODE_317_length_11122_cov_0.359521:5304-4267(-)
MTYGEVKELHEIMIYFSARSCKYNKNGNCIVSAISLCTKSNMYLNSSAFSRHFLSLISVSMTPWMCCGNNDPKIVDIESEYIRSWSLLPECNNIISGKDYVALGNKLHSTVITKVDSHSVNTLVIGSWNNLYTVKDDHVLNFTTNLEIIIPDIICAAGGISHEWLLCKNGDLYGKGNNKQNQLSLYDCNYTEFTLLYSNVDIVLACNNRSILKQGSKYTTLGKFMDIEVEYIKRYDNYNIALGWSSVVLYKNNEFYAVGKNNLLQLGATNTKVNHVLMDFPIDKIVAGSEHYLLLSNKTVFGWGWNEHYNLKSEEENIKFQRLLDNAIDIECGPAVSFVKLDHRR